jgi:O-antigen ligase
MFWALFYTVAAGLIAAGLLASWSRGAWIGAVAALGIVLFVRNRQSALVGIGIVVLGLLAGLIGAFQPNLLPAAVTQRVQDIPAFLGLTDVLSQPLTDENFAVVERVAHWVAAVRMWEQAPWLGIGPGNYATVYPQVHLPRWDEALGHAHNIYLNVLAESGLLGLITFLLFWVAVGLWVVRAARLPQQAGWHKALAIGVLGMLVHLGVHNFFDNLFVQGIYLHIALWLALVLVAESPQSARLETSDSVNK